MKPVEVPRKRRGRPVENPGEAKPQEGSGSWSALPPVSSDGFRREVSPEVRFRAHLDANETKGMGVCEGREALAVRRRKRPWRGEPQGRTWMKYSGEARGGERGATRETKP